MTLLDVQLPPSATATPTSDLERGTDDRGRHRHGAMLITSAVVVLFAFLLAIRSDGRVAFRFAPTHALPESCPTHALFDFDCPGCGLTRSIVSLAHGHWQQSLAFHRLGWLMAAVIVLQIPYRLLLITRGHCPGISSTVARRFAMALAIAIVLNWLLKLI